MNKELLIYWSRVNYELDLMSLGLKKQNLVDFQLTELPKVWLCCSDVSHEIIHTFETSVR